LEPVIRRPCVSNVGKIVFVWRCLVGVWRTFFSSTTTDLTRPQRGRATLRS